MLYGTFTGIMKLNISRIKYELSRQSMNQSQLAAKLGVSRQLFSYWMRNPTGVKLANITLIASGLEIDPKDLISMQPAAGETVQL
jgi:transcriptional regulator with XRE-family HTH domain